MDLVATVDTDSVYCLNADSSHAVANIFKNGRERQRHLCTEVHMCRVVSRRILIRLYVRYSYVPYVPRSEVLIKERRGPTGARID